MKTPGVRFVWLRAAGSFFLSLGLAACGGNGSAPQTNAEKGAAAGPPTIETVRVVEQPLNVTLSLPGEMNPYQTVAIFPRVTGFVKTIVVDRGSRLRAGDLLTKGAGTVVQRDTNFTTQRAAEAQLEADEAMRQNILAQITYSEIRAPVSGRIGSIPYKAGTTLRIGDNTITAVLATINQVDPIFVQFAMPQVYLPDLRAAMAKGEVKVNAIIDDKRKQSGAMAFIENTVDPKLLEILVCPLTKGPLEFDAAKQELISRSAKLAYPIRDGIPIMLPEEARKID